MSVESNRNDAARDGGSGGDGPLHVCFFAPLLWPLWSGGQVAFTGGAEVQQAALAAGLAARGVTVTVVGRDFGQPSPTMAHGVRVLSAYRAESGWPVLRFFHPRLSGALRALNAASPDVYFVRGASLEAGVAYEVARARGVPFVFGAAHEHDAHPALPELASLRDRIWFRRALRGAADIVAQTEIQQRLFREHWNRPSVLVRNLVDLPARAADPALSRRVVWLATYKASKRPDWFLALARALPELEFTMCGIVPVPPMTTAAWEEANAAARELPNLEVMGFVEHDRVEELYRRAALFVHTSPAEGFSNTVLEAWASGVPTIVCTDPDGVVAREGLGEVVSTPAGLQRAVAAWMADPLRRRDAGARARRHVSEQHAPGAVIERMERVFREVRRARA
jgi:glycosyltransferase involved in cell wall biosynthesis